MRYAPVHQPLSVALLIVVSVLVLMGVAQTFLLLGDVDLNAVLYVGDESVGSMCVEYLLGGVRGLVDRLALVLYFAVALYTIKMMVGKMVLEKRTYLAAVFYMLFIGVLSGGCVTLEVGLVSLLFAVSCSLFLQSFRRDSLSYDYVFRAGFTLGIIPIFFAPTLLLFPLILAACVAFRRSFKEYCLAVCGYLLPLLIGSYFCWAIGYPIGFMAKNIWSGLGLESGAFFSILELQLAKLIFIGVYILLSLCAILGFYGHIQSMRNSSIRMFNLFVCAMVCCLAMMILPNYSVATSVVVALPFAIVIPALFTVFRTWLSLLIYISVAVFAMVLMMCDIVPFF